QWLQHADIQTGRLILTAGSGRRLPMQAVLTHAPSKADRVREVIAWPAVVAPSWQAGFLAGIFDAAGSYSAGILRMCTTDPHIIDAIAAALRTFDFGFRLEHLHRELAQPIGIVRLL